MKYINKIFSIEKVSAIKLAKRFGTPIYCYSYNKIKENVLNFRKNFDNFKPLICFSVKSNSNLYLLREIKKLGFGADVVSIGELIKALKAGVEPKKIVFSGVGKTSGEISYAINKKILLINAESKSEIIKIEKIAKSKRKVVEIGIRLNPNIDAKTLSQISTGKKTNKFGVEENELYRLINLIKKSKYLKLSCLSVHIGSQILDYKPYIKMLKILGRIIDKSRHKFKFIDLGGGMGISYGDKIKKLNYQKYSKEVNKFYKKYKAKIIFEPGRSVIADAGVLISEVIYIKKTNYKNFVILDAGMNDLMRPALYRSKHKIIPAIKRNQLQKKNIEFVGPICETTDSFLILKKFQKIKEGEILVICDVGAYGMSLSSNYNLRPRPIELLIKEKKINIIKKRERILDII
tara:strand:- start:1033 stop:2247 length:1215 start_codon:yes stop_codon:yes gene_type:complete